ncbi:flotillin-like protein 6 [Spinacia oleracea]|uniref:Flotillin-like n=1 Tax=Spinacia oleracea TaxID=3562 RepID=A0A9R0JDK1_SPIOL|nr:flotillin-like protein 6 [Spinacia oleracea]
MCPPSLNIMTDCQWMTVMLILMSTRNIAIKMRHAEVDVAEAQMKGESGAKLRQGQTAQNAAKIDVETKIIATQRDGEGKKEEAKVRSDVKIFENQKEDDVAKASAELVAQKVGWSRAVQLAEACDQ